MSSTFTDTGSMTVTEDKASDSYCLNSSVALPSGGSSSSAPLLFVRSLQVLMPGGGSAAPLAVVRNVDLQVQPGEFVALVGESGCGKSMTAMSVTRLPPTDTATVKGVIKFEGRDLTSLTRQKLRKIRGRQIAYIFQDPGSALNPVLKIGEQIREAMPVTGKNTRDSPAPLSPEELLDMVRLPRPRTILRSYPHELSGGMQQRVLVAMAIAARPKLVIADEPTTALDVTTQKQVLDLLNELRQSMGLAIMLITHNLGIVASYAEKMFVMYAGETIESGSTADVLSQPLHPYTAGLMAAVPRLDSPSLTSLRPIPGRVPPPGAWGEGCAFEPRCSRALPQCRRTAAPLQLPSGGRTLRCHLPSAQSGQQP